MTDAFIGIDQSYSGFAVGIWMPSLNEFEYHLNAYAPKKYGDGVDRLRAITSDLRNDLANMAYGRGLDVRHVCMEGYAAEAKFGREKSGELGAVVKLALSMSLPPLVNYPTIVSPTALKKYVTGKGNARKDDMKLCVFKKWGETCHDDNVADSYGLARLAEALHTGVTNHKYEEEVIAKLTPHTERWPKAA